MNTNRASMIFGQSYGKGFVIGGRLEIDCHDYRGKEVEIMLQRQGCATTLNCSHPAFFVEFFEYQGKGWSAEFCYGGSTERYGFHYAGQKIGRTEGEHNTLESCKQEVIKALNDKFGFNLTIRDEVIDYCFSSHTYKYQDNDIIVSPVAYDPERRVIMDLDNEIPLVKFGDPEGDILNINWRMASDSQVERVKAIIKDHATGYIRDQNPDYVKMVKSCIENVMRAGFHTCGYKRGTDYCARRFAWLLGCYMMKYQKEVIGCPSGSFFMVNHRMEVISD